MGHEVGREVMPRKEPTTEPGEHQFEPNYPRYRSMSIGSFNVSLKMAITNEREKEVIYRLSNHHLILKRWGICGK